MYQYQSASVEEQLLDLKKHKAIAERRGHTAGSVALIIRWQIWHFEASSSLRLADLSLATNSRGL